MGGKGLAAQLGIDGLRLRIHDVDDAQVAGIRAAGGLNVEGRDKNFAPIEMATTDLAAAVKGADVLLVSIYGNHHADLALQLAPVLSDGQTIVLIQGHFAGALLFKTALDRAGCKAKVDVAEMDGYPYMLTVKTSDTVLLTTTKKKWQLAAMPQSRTAAVLEKIGSAFPGLVPARTCSTQLFWILAASSTSAGSSPMSAVWRVMNLTTSMLPIWSRASAIFWRPWTMSELPSRVRSAFR